MISHMQPVEQKIERDPFLSLQKELQKECPRFATMGFSRNAGLGHKFAEIVFGMDFAEETNSTYVIDERALDARGKHGSYKWFLKFLPLLQQEIPLSKVRSLKKIATITGRWNQLVQRSYQNKTCNVLLLTSLHTCCDHKKTCYCTKSRVGAFERVKWRMRDAFMKSTYTPSRQLDDLIEAPMKNVTHSGKQLTITWHLRSGDFVINANNPEYFEHVASQLASVLSNAGVSFHVFFFGENDMLQKFPFVPGICQRHLHGQCSYPKSSVMETLYYMTKSDILVTSGSSFPAVAALLRTDGIVLNAVPKENLIGVYEVNEQGRLAVDGTIVKPSLHQLTHQLQTIASREK